MNYVDRPCMHALPASLVRHSRQSPAATLSEDMSSTSPLFPPPSSHLFSSSSASVSSSSPVSSLIHSFTRSLNQGEGEEGEKGEAGEEGEGDKGEEEGQEGEEGEEVEEEDEDDSNTNKDDGVGSVREGAAGASPAGRWDSMRSFSLNNDNNESDGTGPTLPLETIGPMSVAGAGHPVHSPPTQSPSAAEGGCSPQAGAAARATGRGGAAAAAGAQGGLTAMFGVTNDWGVKAVKAEDPVGPVEVQSRELELELELDDADDDDDGDDDDASSSSLCLLRTPVYYSYAGRMDCEAPPAVLQVRAHTYTHSLFGECHVIIQSAQKAVVLFNYYLVSIYSLFTN
eukprot:GHVU01121305.1.p1 GENE.GHVU01121305.1~~GHVU01121305.1.p1  ORF type:complete len:341 (-),score=86.81 GHVU01121305.1:148-1170(-)